MATHPDPPQSYHRATETYINIEKMVFMAQDDGKFDVKVADTLDDAIKLLEIGFEYHCEVEGHKLSYRMAVEWEIDRWKGFREALPSEEE
ncbi:MAG: hypothetical protein ABSD42_14715 [Candidatus Bathyarchaeia archaeon]|jgi:hypothetical protein